MIIDKPTITEQEWHKEVAAILKQYIFLKLPKRSTRLARKLFKDGYSPKDAAGILLLNSQ